MRAMPAWSVSSAAEVTRPLAPGGNARGSRPGAAQACPRRATVNHCGLPVAIARVRVSRKPAATRCADATSWPRARPRNDTAVTVTAIAISTITASISIRVKAAKRRERGTGNGKTREWLEPAPREGLLFPVSGSRFPALLPIPVITVDALAPGLAVAAVEQDVVLAMLAGIDVAVGMSERIIEVGGLGVWTVPRRRVQRLGDQVIQRLRRRTIVERVGLHVLVELGDADLAGIPFAGIDPARHRTRHDHADDAQQHDHGEHFQQGEARCAHWMQGTGNREQGTVRGGACFSFPAPRSSFPLFQKDHAIVSNRFH